ncbi:MAG: hypothetical protein ABSF93_10125 [Candidatus Sulfotelmatobacter sp.]
MAKHKFAVAVNEGGVTVGAQCIRCGAIVMYQNGQIPEDLREQECKREDASQAAVRIVREATEDR